MFYIKMFPIPLINRDDMLQKSKIIQSREEWREKAIERGYQVREFKKNQRRHLEKIAELKRHNRKLIEANTHKKKTSCPPQN